MTRTLARQMSGPVPSPSMKGMIGFSGTRSLPSCMPIFAPCGGGVIFELASVDIEGALLEGNPGAGGAGRAMLAQGIAPRPGRTGVQPRMRDWHAVDTRGRA